MGIPVNVEQIEGGQGASQLALGGLLWGIGMLDAVEVLRYLDAAFGKPCGEQIREEAEDQRK